MALSHRMALDTSGIAADTTTSLESLLSGAGESVYSIYRLSQVPKVDGPHN
jgi:hypothetical protein